MKTAFKSAYIGDTAAVQIVFFFLFLLVIYVYIQPFRLIRCRYLSWVFFSFSTYIRRGMISYEKANKGGCYINKLVWIIYCPECSETELKGYGSCVVYPE